MHNTVKVKGIPGLVRDVETKAIINTDSNDYEKHVRARQLLPDKDRRISNLENEVADIKKMLFELLKDK